MKRLLLTVLMLLTATTAQGQHKARLVLHWYPQAQFVGYYMGLEKGFYARQGLDLTIIPGGPDVHPLHLLEDGQAEFATAFLSTALDRHDAGLDLVHIGQVVHDSALMLIAKKSDGLQTLADLQGKRVGMWNSDLQIQPRALFKRMGIGVRVVQQAPSLDLFMRGGLDAVSAMWYNEYHTLMSYGLEPEGMQAFFFRDLDLNFPEDCICTMRGTLARPELIRALRQGTVDGWNYALAHPEEALSLIIRVMKEHKVRANRSHQRWMLARMADIILARGRTAVDLTLPRADYERTVTALHEAGVIESTPAYEDFVIEVQP